VNWYKLSQWQKMRRQREFPFAHEPGYFRKGKPWIDPEYVEYEAEQYNDQLNLYHVTTDLPGVISAGKLLSRKELGYKNIGLGGGIKNEAASMVSATYNYSKALQIYETLKHTIDIAHGKVKASDIFNSFWGQTPHDEALDEVLNDFLPDGAIQEIDTTGNSDAIIDQHIKGPKNIYNFFQKLEQKILWEELQQDDTYNISQAGATADFDSVMKINPANIAILQLVAKKDAQPEHIPIEQELRFLSQDLKVVRYLQP